MSEWIVSRPDVCGGKPCIAGTRISVEFVLELLANGATQPDILRRYPPVPQEGLSAALQYAANALRNEVMWEMKLSA